MDHFNVKDGKIRAIIRSKYTYSRFLKGRAIVSIEPYSLNAWTAQYKVDASIKVIRIDGKRTVEFDIADELGVELNDDEQSVAYELRAIVIEELTGRNQSATKRIQIHLRRYKINAVDLESKFQTGLPVQVNVAVTYQDNKPVMMVNEATKNIIIEKVPNNQNLSETFYKYELLANGTGGFQGTQDTVLGLQALAKYAERILTKENNVQMVTTSDDANETHISVSMENALVLQSFEVN